MIEYGLAGKKENKNTKKATIYDLAIFQEHLDSVNETWEKDVLFI